MGSAFVVMINNTSPSPRSKRFYPMVKSKCFVVLHFTTNSMIHFQLIWVEDMKFRLRFIKKVHGCLIDMEPSVEKTVFLPLN